VAQLFSLGLASIFKLFDIFKKTKPAQPSRAARESDFGRRFGWFIERGEERIGELEYLRWDSDAQFWHNYRLIWRRPEDAVVGPDAWISAGLVLRSRRYTDVVISSFLTGAQRQPDIIKVRGASVPADRIHDDEA
jgi:hypothetical protein